jgi:hypothetical protein
VSLCEYRSSRLPVTTELPSGSFPSKYLGSMFIYDYTSTLCVDIDFNGFI